MKIHLILLVILFPSPLLASERTPTQFHSVSEMMETFRIFQKENNTFKVFSESPLKIRVSPLVLSSDFPDVISRRTSAALLFAVYRTFVHTSVTEIIVRAVPLELDTSADKTRLLGSYGIEILVTRDRALEVLKKFFPQAEFSDLVYDDKYGSILLKDQDTEIFKSMSLPDRGFPGVDAVFTEITKR